MKNSEDRLGYKKTKVGWIPEDWRIETLGSSKHFLTSGSRGWSRYYSDRGELFVRITNLTRNRINLDYTDCRFVILPEGDRERARTRLRPGDVMISITADLGIVAYFDDGEPFPGAYVSQHVALLRLFDMRINPRYVALQLSAPRSQRRFRQITDQGAKAGLNLPAIRTFPVLLPPVREQEAIAEILECWDRAIRGYERKIQAKCANKKGLMQRLLAGKQRLPGFDGEWKEIRLGHVATLTKGQQLSREDQTETGRYPVLNGGVQPLGFTDNWNTEAETITISEGGNSCGFVNFNRSRFWCGGHCYALNEHVTLADRAFLYQSLKYLQSSIMRLRVGSGLPNIQKKTLANFRLHLPSLQEQRFVGGVLSQADTEIGLLERKLTVLRTQKRFLLNNLVTGAIRLPHFLQPQTTPKETP